MKRMFSKKGQAAIEYLATYAWALFALLLVVGVTATLILHDSARVSLDCTFGDHFMCTEIIYNEASTSFRLAIKNVETSVILNGVEIEVLDGECAIDPDDVTVSNLQATDTQSIGQTTVASYPWIAQGRKLFTIVCDTSDRFTLEVKMVYTESDGIYLKSSTGRIIGER
jgi:hypothetical protein